MPLSLDFKFKFVWDKNHIAVNEITVPMQPKFIWDTNKQVNYNYRISANLNSIAESFYDALENNDCERSLHMLMQAINSAADIMKKRIFNVPGGSIIKKDTKQWFDEECQKSHMKALRARRSFRHIKTQDALNQYKESRSEYKKLTKIKKADYFEKQSMLLSQAANDKKP